MHKPIFYLQTYELQVEKMSNNKAVVEEAIIAFCKDLTKEGKDKEEKSQWLEDKFGVSLWSIADMEPETLKEILDDFQENPSDS